MVGGSVITYIILQRKGVKLNDKGTWEVLNELPSMSLKK